LALVPNTALMSAITLAELNVGVLRAINGAQRTSASRWVRTIAATIELVPFGEKEALVWAELFDGLRRSGRMIGLRDLFIAATAVAGAHSVMTGNRGEFERVPGLAVIDSL
jgi:tRNA(fMet)-specific endonuclease VapC